MKNIRYFKPRLLSILLLSSLAACSAAPERDPGERAPVMRMDESITKDTTYARKTSKPQPILDETSVKTIQALEARIRFLERKLAAVTGYTPNELKPDYESKTPVARNDVADPRRSVRMLTPPPAEPLKAAELRTDYFDRQRQTASTAARMPSASPAVYASENQPSRHPVGNHFGQGSVIPASYQQPSTYLPARYEASGSRYDLVYAFRSQEESDDLIRRLSRTHVAPKMTRSDGQYLVQVGSFPSEEPARIRRNYLVSIVGLAPEMRLRR